MLVNRSKLLEMMLGVVVTGGALTEIQRPRSTSLQTMKGVLVGILAILNLIKVLNFLMNNDRLRHIIWDIADTFKAFIWWWTYRRHVLIIRNQHCLTVLYHILLILLRNIVYLLKRLSIDNVLEKRGCTRLNKTSGTSRAFRTSQAALNRVYTTRSFELLRFYLTLTTCTGEITLRAIT